MNTTLYLSLGDSVANYTNSYKINLEVLFTKDGRTDIEVYTPDYEIDEDTNKTESAESLTVIVSSKIVADPVVEE